MSSLPAVRMLPWLALLLILLPGAVRAQAGQEGPEGGEPSDGDTVGGEGEGEDEGEGEGEGEGEDEDEGEDEGVAPPPASADEGADDEVIWLDGRPPNAEPVTTAEPAPADDDDVQAWSGAPNGPPSWPRIPDANPDGSPASTASARAKYTDFVRTVLTFHVGDDNVLAGPEVQSPSPGIGYEYQELFYDGLNAEKAQVVSETHMVVYGKMPGFLPFVDTEAAFVAELEFAADPQDGRVAGEFREDGSYVGITFWFNRAKKGKSLKFTGWPYRADRFRLGFLFDLTWGGDDIYPATSAPAPGAKLHLDLERFYVYLGAKSMQRTHADLAQTESFWGVLAGLGPNVWFGPESRMQLRYDVNGGYFERGTFEHFPFRSTPLIAFGVSQRLLLSYNDPRMGRSVDQNLLKNDPEALRQASFIPLRYYGTFAFGVSGEFTTLWQRVRDFDDLDTLVHQNALAAAARGQVRFLKNLRVGLDVVYRDVAFLLFNATGEPAFTSNAAAQTLSPQVYGALWVDYYIEALHLRPEFTVGLMQPAARLAAPDAQGNRQTAVIRAPGEEEVLPTGQDPFTILSVRGRLTWGLSHMLAVVGEISFTQDYNRVFNNARPGQPGEAVLSPERAQALGMTLLVQAAF
jgi:hypothetical protein